MQGQIEHIGEARPQRHGEAVVDVALTPPGNRQVERDAEHADSPPPAPCAPDHASSRGRAGHRAGARDRSPARALRDLLDRGDRHGRQRVGDAHAAGCPGGEDLAIGAVEDPVRPVGEKTSGSACSRPSSSTFAESVPQTLTAIRRTRCQPRKPSSSSRSAASRPRPRRRYSRRPPSEDGAATGYADRGSKPHRSAPRHRTARLRRFLYDSPP